MNMRFVLLSFCLAFAARAQYVEILGSDLVSSSRAQLNKKPASRTGSGAPSGSCATGLDYYIDTATSALYGCVASTWALLINQTDLQSALAAKEAVLTFSAPLSRSVNAISCPTCVITSGTYADPSWITSLAGAKISGSVPTATALNANPTDCTAGQYATTIAANGDLTCAAVAYLQVSGTPTLAAVATSGSASDLSTGTLAAARGGAGTVNGLLRANGTGTVSAAAAGTDYVIPSGNVATATALATDPTACAAGQFVSDIAANGTLTCGTPAGGGSSTTACEIIIGDPGAATPILADDNDTPAICSNVSGTTQTITAIACWANAGTPTVRPIITGGASNSLLSADLTCGTGSYATGTLNGTPTLANGATIDANIASAGGVAKYLVIRITRQ